MTCPFISSHYNRGTHSDSAEYFNDCTLTIPVFPNNCQHSLTTVKKKKKSNNNKQYFTISNLCQSSNSCTQSLCSPQGQKYANTPMYVYTQVALHCQQLSWLRLAQFEESLREGFYNWDHPSWSYSQLKNPNFFNFS